MTEINDPELYQPELPTEILTQIFLYLPARNLIVHRRVCTRWKDIIDSLKNKHSLWQNYCMQDYKHMFLQTRHRKRVEISYYELYRAFSLWSNLRKTILVKDEFAPASRTLDEITSFTLLPEDKIGVHTRSGIVYYDLKTLNRMSEDMIVYGKYVKYDENKNAIVLLNEDHCLFVTLKVVNFGTDEFHATFDNATNFILLDGKVYYIKDNVELFVCNYHENLSCTYINTCKEDIACLGYKDDTLYFVTYERNIYKLVGTNLEIVCSLNNSNSLLHTMSTYNLLEHLDWHMYSHWMYSLSRNIPEGPLRALIVVHVYGDVIFIGTMWGVLRIYYAPYTNGELDFYNTEPVKQFNFMEPDTCPVLSYSPIMHIDVVEGIDEHTVLVAMPKKIAVLKFVHDFNEDSSTQYVKNIYCQ